jgi:hypothetical protein
MDLVGLKTVKLDDILQEVSSVEETPLEPLCSIPFNVSSPLLPGV